MTKTITMIKLWKVNTDTNDRTLVTIACTALGKRLLDGITDQLEFHLEGNEKLEKEFIYE